MRQKVYRVLNRVYAILMFASFFAGILPLVPFLIALIIGGSAGEKIAVFLYQQYYPWVIVVGCLAILIGLVAMYIGKIEGLSVKKVNADDKGSEEKPEK